MNSASPSLRIERLHVRGLRGLRRVDLPEGGLGWADNTMPDLVVLAGANGSGKTTLLRCLTQAARCLLSSPAAIPSSVDAEECLIDFGITDGAGEVFDVRFLVGSADFVAAHRTARSYGYVQAGDRMKVITSSALANFRKIIRVPDRLASIGLPGLVFVPADDRDLIVPTVTYRAPGQLTEAVSFVEEWGRLAPGQWSGSTIELLYSARWADLNAREAGSPQLANSFERYVKAFNDITGASKNLGWTARGELVVELGDGSTHPVDDLSAGERQLLLLLAELRRLWRPGSLVLIDEPELHLHDRWQARLLDVLVGMQQELGGQVIMATQSQSLFEMAGLGTRVLLGRDRLR